MLTRDEVLLATVKKLASVAMTREITTLKRKLKEVTAARDDYRETAQRYQRQIIELKSK